MASLTGLSARIDQALREARFALLPTTGDAGATAINNSTRFPSSGAWAPGDSVIIAANDKFHMIAGDALVTATTSSPGVFPAGTYKFVVPDGCTHVALIQASGATTTASVYRG